MISRLSSFLLDSLYRLPNPVRQRGPQDLRR